jgi:hypothetical protein
VDELTDNEEEFQDQVDTLPNDVCGRVEVYSRDDESYNEPNGTAGVKWKRGKAQMDNFFQQMEEVEKLEDRYPLLANKTPYELFEIMFLKEMRQLIVRETKRYAVTNNEHFSFSERDLLSFLAIIFVTGYNQRPCQHLYWSKEKDVECPLIPAISCHLTNLRQLREI